MWWYVIKRVDNDEEVGRTNSRRYAVEIARDRANELQTEMYIIPEKEEEESA